LNLLDKTGKFLEHQKKNREASMRIDAVYDDKMKKIKAKREFKLLKSPKLNWVNRYYYSP